MDRGGDLRGDGARRTAAQHPLRAHQGRRRGAPRLRPRPARREDPGSHRVVAARRGGGRRRRLRRSLHLPHRDPRPRRGGAGRRLRVGAPRDGRGLLRPADRRRTPGGGRRRWRGRGVGRRTARPHRRGDDPGSRPARPRRPDDRFRRAPHRRDRARRRREDHQADARRDPRQFGAGRRARRADLLPDNRGVLLRVDPRRRLRGHVHPHRRTRPRRPTRAGGGPLGPCRQPHPADRRLPHRQLLHDPRLRQEPHDRPAVSRPLPHLDELREPHPGAGDRR